MLDYEDFIQKFTEELQQRIPEAEINRTDVKKANVTLDALSINADATFPGLPTAQAAPLIYLNDIYKRHEAGFTPSECADAIKDFIDESRYDLPSLPQLNKDTAKEQLYAVVLNKNMSKNYLEDAITRDIPGTDLTIAARFHVGEIKGNHASFLVTETNCSLFEMSPSEVLDIAFDNSAKDNYRCMSLADTLADIMQKQGAPEEMINEMRSSQEMMPPIYMLSNNTGIDGAVAIAFPEVMKDACNSIGEERCYVIPSSRHEVLLIPESFGNEAGVEELNDMVKSVNQSEVNDEDQLSDSVYLWNGKSLVMADSKEMTQGLLRSQNIPFDIGSSDSGITKSVKNEAPKKSIARSR